MQAKNLQSLFSSLTDNNADVEVLSKELATQLKSGAQSSQEPFAPKPAEGRPALGAWLHRLSASLTQLGRSE
jgi:hypothetical protein